MQSLGIMTNDLSKEHLYFTAIAKEAIKLNLNVYRFTPQAIDSTKKMIQGECFHRKDHYWTKRLFPVPEFIYDRTFHGLTRQSNETRKNINWLKQDTNFIGYGLPGKWEVYQTLKEDAFLQAFLPPTEKLQSPADAAAMLTQFSSIILKPEYGSRGSGIFVLTKMEKGTEVSMQKQAGRYKRSFTTEEELNKWLERLLTKYHYLGQPFLTLFTQEQEPFDIRSLLQKNEENNWIERGRGIRKGKKDGITSNLATGGRAYSYDSYLDTLSIAAARQLEPMIERIYQTLPVALETKFNRLFELGVDLGRDQDGKVWILDINSKPGRKIIEKLHPEQLTNIFSAPGLFCKYLASELSKAGQSS
ncbi:YheC/YheD family protein [Peribacillus sp. FSL H8-0477]|uniref:YheC/YheD family endospore coat-associated protein n=1 Tax=Peribacillus sp. FSL H8-0477 TaxID=2921388 RepID=UPI0030F94BA7